MIPFPEKKYKIIYADPPWDYHTAWKRENSDSAGIWGLANNHYQTIEFEQLKKLPINNIADADCFLFMWATFPQLNEALELIKAWGFEYKTVAFNWIKKHENGSYFVGMGWYTRANAEVCLIAKKGNPKIKDHGINQIIESSPKKHSQKPNIIRDKIIQLCGDLPRIELFARTKVHGWDVWGNDEKLNLQPLEAYQVSEIT